jgi:hypothetical protein
MLVAVIISATDVAQNANRIYSFLQGEHKSFKQFWRTVILQKGEALGNEAEYTGLIVDDPEEFEFDKLQRRESDQTHVAEEGDEWVNAVRRPGHRRISSHLSETTIVGRSNSDDTLDEASGKTLEKKRKGWRSGLVVSVVESSLVVAGMAELLVGIVVYTGMNISRQCRCGAHLRFQADADRIGSTDAWLI